MHHKIINLMNQWSKGLRYCYKLLFLLLLVAPGVHIAFAKFMTIDDAPYTLVEKDLVTIDAEAKSTVTISMAATIRKESARGFFQKFALSYTQDASQVKIKEAYTMYKGKKYPVLLSQITDKSLETGNSGFDSARQVSIPFQKVRLGAVIYLKYQYFQRKVPFKGFYSGLDIIGGAAYLTKYHVQYDSKPKLYGVVHDPKNALKVSGLSAQGFHHLDIMLKHPLTSQTINEPGFWPLSPGLKTWLSLSTHKTWAPIAQVISPDYEKVLAQKLPVSYQKTVQLAAKKKSLLDQINLLTTTVQNKIQYLGSWRTIHGQLFPRDLSVITDSGYGDCKEYATLVVKMLRVLGYKADVALVFRGMYYQNYPHQLPGAVNFNHAIVHLVTQKGKELWIDPTNFVSGAGKIFRDISGRMSLILNKKNPTYQKIPQGTFKDSTIEVHANILIRPKSVKKVLTIRFDGLAAKPYTGMGLQWSKKQIENYFYTLDQYVQPGDRLKSTIPDLTSRIISPIVVTLPYIKHDPFIETNLGKAILFGSQVTMPVIPDDSVRDMPMSVGKVHSIVKYDVSIEKVQRLNVKIHSPWMDWVRSCSSSQEGTLINTQVVAKKNITWRDRETKVFKQFQKKINKYNKSVALILPKQGRLGTLLHQSSVWKRLMHRIWG